VRDLNRLYARTPALHRNDCRPEGFEWLEMNDAANSVLAWVRKGAPTDPMVVVAVNMTPVERAVYRLGFPAPGRWREALNTDAGIYGGGNRGNLGGVVTDATPWMGQSQSASIVLPPLSAVFFVQDN
jgi:1,4-alpha-glucan branching enzyme